MEAGKRDALASSLGPHLKGTGRAGPKPELGSERAKGTDLAFPAQGGARDQRLAEEHADVIEQVPRGDVVRAVQDNVVRRDERPRRRRREQEHVGVAADVRVEAAHARGAGLGLGRAGAARLVEHLALQVADLDRVVVDQAQRA